ncbi:MAG: agmatine deiminase family protein [Muribaculaceae bacterium]|nr:agmatine deiminase family protein [Muribaculaceae bacterium]
MYKTRFLAEWEPQGGILMALPDTFTDWEYMLIEVLDCYARIISAMTSEGVRVVLLCASRERAVELLGSIVEQPLVTLVEAEYNDTWTRDYGPLAVERAGRNRALDFGFNGWGLKFASDRDNLVNLHLRDKFIILPAQYRNERDFTLEGGSVETDGRGTILTTTRCLTSPNRNGGKSIAQLNEILHDRLGASHVLWLNYGALEGDDTDSHIDTLARMAPGDTIIFIGCRNVDDPHFEQLLTMRAELTLFRTPSGDPYNLVELPLPDPIYDSDGCRLPATYANYLVTDRVIFMPTYAQPANDTLACQTIRIAFPDHKVVPVDCRALICQHGSLHCATMQLHAGFFNDAIGE